MLTRDPALAPYRRNAAVLGGGKVSRPDEILRWAIDTFGPIAADRHERAARFLEEAMELAQVEGVSHHIAKAIADRVYSRPTGTLTREVGQAQVTLECLAANVGVDADEEAAKEFDRVRSISPDKFRKKQAAKAAIGIAGR